MDAATAEAIRTETRKDSDRRNRAPGVRDERLTPVWGFLRGTRFRAR